MKNCKIVGKFKKGVSSIFYLLRNDQYLSLSNEYVKVFYYRKLQSSRWWKNANLLYTGKYKKNKIHDGVTPRVNEMEHIFNICHVFPVPYLWEKYELSREIFWKGTRNRFERPVIRVVRCSSYHVNFIRVCYWRFQATGKKRLKWRMFGLPEIKSSRVNFSFIRPALSPHPSPVIKW